MSKKNLLLVVIVLGVAVSVWYLEHMKVSPAGTGTGGAAQAINISFDAANVSVTSDASSSVTSSPSSPATASSLNTTQVREMLATISAQDKKAGYQPAIEIVGPTGFVNASSTFKLADLIGKKVILLDFWTYSCVNCVRTLPYLTSWYSKYKDQGLVIVGVHTPEFDFEKNIDNVRTAAKQYGIEYPIVLDSNYGTWNAYGNLYWPHEYLIDIAGYIVHDHIGEGSYDETEGLIQKLLAERATALGVSTSSIAKSDVNIKPADLNGIGSPETYFGSARNELLANGTPFTNGTQTLTEPASPDLNKLYLAGKWNFTDQYATNADSGAKIIYKYDSAKVYFVGSGVPAGTVLDVIQDGKPIGAAAGADVHDGKVTITGSRLYSIANNPGGSGEHTLELIIESPGLQAFTFTFG